MIHESNNFVTFDSTMKYSCNINKWIFHTSNNTINLEFFDIFQVFSPSFSLQSNRCIQIFTIFDQCFTSSHQMLIQLWMMSRLKWKFTITKMTDQEIRDNPVQFNLDVVVVCFIQNLYFYFHNLIFSLNFGQHSAFQILSRWFTFLLFFYHF